LKKRCSSVDFPAATSQQLALVSRASSQLSLAPHTNGPRDVPRCGALSSGTADFYPEKPSKKLCVGWLCTQERWNPKVANILGTAAHYRRATAGSSHDGKRPNNSSLHATNQQSCPFPAAAASRRRRNDLGTTIKYLRETTSGAAGIGLGTTIKYPRRTAGTAAGLRTTLNYLRGAAGNGRAKRSSTFGAQRAPPLATAWAPR
jgi:hypothetical protein